VSSWAIAFFKFWAVEKLSENFLLVGKLYKNRRRLSLSVRGLSIGLLVGILALNYLSSARCIVDIYTAVGLYMVRI